MKAIFINLFHYLIVLFGYPRFLLILFVTGITTFSPTMALAYVDPNTGGFIFQLFYPIFVVVGISYLFLKRQIKKLFLNFINLIQKTFGK